MKLSNINEIIYELMCEDKRVRVDEEDLLAIKAGKYK